ncbi:MAG: hypothetical protein PHE18_06660 [Candidatus Omnitrophica bacterium]|nr:hypothetical protein [Candidatus Omnitrophota bacterium]MDD5553540.1 hypothetical protein [Candidatus Omnitrophota bacterium]
MVNNNKKKVFKLSKRLTALIFSIIALALLASFLKSRIAVLKNEQAKDLAVLENVLPGFDAEALKKLNKDIADLETELARMASVFDPDKNKVKKDYDLPIYFVEELSKTKEALKAKAADKGITYPELGFKETLPDDKEAVYLLKQLNIIKEAVEKGMDSEVNFNSITPQAMEDLGMGGIKLLKTSLEFTAGAREMIDFLIRLSESVPISSVETMLVKQQGPGFRANMALDNVVIETDWKEKPIRFAPLNLKEIFFGQEKNISSLRANNPFLGTQSLEPASLPPQPPAEVKQGERFLYQGKAILRSKEVAVLEDTLRKETFFLAVGEKEGGFILKSMTDTELILKNAVTGEEISVKRQEK